MDPDPLVYMRRKCKTKATNSARAVKAEITSVKDPSVIVVKPQKKEQATGSHLTSTGAVGIQSTQMTTGNPRMR